MGSIDDEKIMEIAEYKNIYNLENKHFYYVSLRELVIGLIKRYSRQKLKILDVGCGAGLLLKELNKIGESSGIDYSQEAVKLSKKRGMMVKRASVENLPFNNNSFNVVTCLDVLVCKEVKDVKDAINEMRRILKPNGILIIRVSAKKYLKSAHDDYVHSVRRYEVPEIRKIIKSSRMKILFISYTNFILWPLAFINALFEKIRNKKPKSIVGEINFMVNLLLLTILRMENLWLLGGQKLPTGNGIIAVTKK